MRVLIVEDEKEIREFMKAALESESFAVDSAEDGASGSYMARTNEYDVIILDNMLPKKTGLQVCQDIRNSGRSTPILVLSALSEIDDKASLLDQGADDYLTKPYSHKELMSRMRALTRRGAQVDDTVLRAGSIVLDTAAQEATVAGSPVHLTRKEFALLELLMRGKGRVVSRGAIMEHVWDMEGDPFSKTIETHVVNLRRKIEDDSRTVIVNVPGRGYRIDA